MPCACWDWPKVERLSYIINMKITVRHQTRDVKPMPSQCRPTLYEAGPASKRHRRNVWPASPRPMLARCRHVVIDVGPASNQQWLIVSHLLCVEVVQHRPIMVGHFQPNARPLQQTQTPNKCRSDAGPAPQALNQHRNNASLASPVYWGVKRSHIFI